MALASTGTSQCGPDCCLRVVYRSRDPHAFCRLRLRLRVLSMSSSDLNFIYLSEDDSLTAWNTETREDSSTDESGDRSGAATDEPAVVAVTPATTDRVVVRRDIEQALQQWGLDARKVQKKHAGAGANAERTRQEMIRSAVSGWAASPSALREASRQAKGAQGQEERRKQERIQEVLHEWKHGEQHDRAAAPGQAPLLPPPQPVQQGVAHSVAGTHHLSPAAMPASNDAAAMAATAVVDVDLKAESRRTARRVHRKRLVEHVDVDRCLDVVRTMYADDARWKPSFVEDLSRMASKTVVEGVGGAAGVLDITASVAHRVASAVGERIDDGSVFDASTRTGCILRCMARSIVAPIEHALKDAAASRLTFNPLKGSWNVRVSFAGSEVLVSHQRVELAAPGHHEGTAYQFQWRALFVLSVAAPFPGIVLHAAEESHTAALELCACHVKLESIACMFQPQKPSHTRAHVLPLAFVTSNRFRCADLGEERHRDRIVHMVGDLFATDGAT